MNDLRGGTPPPLLLQPLTERHAIAAFSCGDAAIDAFLHSQALSEQAMGLSSVTLAVDAKDKSTVVGFFTLSPLSINLDPRLLAALQIDSAAIPYPRVGGYLLGRMGVKQDYARKGVGSALVAIAVDYARKSRSETGGVFVAVDPKDEQLVGWYMPLGFTRINSVQKRMVLKL